MARNRARSAARRERAAGPAILRMRGLRWVPVPLAVLAAVIGALVMGAFQGQMASANAHQTGYRSGGLALSVDTMRWMPNMKPTSSGYQMPASMMPGMQPAGDNRLHVEISLGNVTTSVQRYSITDFTVSSPGGKPLHADSVAHSNTPVSADLAPGFETTTDIYFDIPAQQSKHLILKWSHGGSVVFIPVNTNGNPSTMRM
jgi:hypothetical protein